VKRTRPEGLQEDVMLALMHCLLNFRTNKWPKVCLFQSVVSIYNMKDCINGMKKNVCWALKLQAYHEFDEVWNFYSVD
jgi:hypothetical protein